MRDLSQVTEFADHRGSDERIGSVRFLLDVDGVINAYAAPADVDLVTRIVVLDGYPYRIRIRPPVLAAIHAWHAHPMVDLRWCTTWQHDANTTLAPAFGLPQLPVVPGFRADADWKRHSAERSLAEGTPLIWCDDVHATWTLVTGSADRRTAALLVAPDPEVGLTPAHLDRIGRFIATYTGHPVPSSD